MCLPNSLLRVFSHVLIDEEHVIFFYFHRLEIICSYALRPLYVSSCVVLLIKLTPLIEVSVTFL